jgi:transcriptional regulator with XRE-family HTH domain
MQHNEYKSVENRLRMIRVVRDFEQVKVANFLGFTNTNKLSRWESGKTLPDLVNAFRLAALYHVLVEDLFKGLYDTVREEVLPNESQAERAPRPVPFQPQLPSTGCSQDS